MVPWRSAHKLRITELVRLGAVPETLAACRQASDSQLHVARGRGGGGGGGAASSREIKEAKAGGAARRGSDPATERHIFKY